MSQPVWLPDLVSFPNCKMVEYEDKLYSFYTDDFIKAKVIFQKVPLYIRKYPMIDSKEYTFWHIIQERVLDKNGNICAEGPDFKRCERIRWPKPILEHVDSDGNIKIWKNHRKNKIHICIWFNDEYLIILKENKPFNAFITGYPTFEYNRIKDLEREYNEYLARSGIK